MQQFKLHEYEKTILNILNQIFEIEKKSEKLTESNSIHRNLKRLKEIFEMELSAFYGSNVEAPGFFIENPIGEPYNEKRTDCEASIAGESAENLVITEVVRPIIRYKYKGQNLIVQKAVVVVQSQNS